MTDLELIDEAIKAREKAYAPYSDFKVGAALITQDNRVYQGCNIENAAYSPTNCAERTAFFQAVANGERKFSKIAIVGGREDYKQPCVPCGVCRQVMMEFCDSEKFEIVTVDGKGGARSYKLKELFPEGFGPNDVKGNE